MMMLKSNTQKIILFLIGLEVPISVASLAARFGISERGLRYNLEEMSDFLEKEGLSLLRKAGAGIQISIPKGYNIEQFSHKLQLMPVKELILDTEEKCSYIISRLLMLSQPITVQKLADELYVGRNTIIKLLDDVERWFAAYKIKLTRKTNYGLKLSYTKQGWQNAMISLLMEDGERDWYYEIADRDENRWFVRGIKNHHAFVITKSEQIIERFHTIVSDIERRKGTQLENIEYIAILSQMKIVLDRALWGNHFVVSEEYMDSITSLPTYNTAKSLLRHLSSEFGVEIDEDETSYLTLQLLCIRKTSEQSKLEKPDAQVAEEIYAAVSSVYHVGGQNRQELLRRITHSIRYAVINNRTNQNAHLPIFSRLMKQYRDLYQAVKAACGIVEQTYRVTLHNGEIAIIASSFLEDDPPGETKGSDPLLRVLVVCMNGVGSARMLSSCLHAAFHNIEVVGVRSIFELENADILQEVDIVISTAKIDMPLPTPVITVSPLLGAEGIAKIGSYINMKYLYSMKGVFKDKLTLDLILDVIDKHVGTKYDRAFVRTELELLLGFKHTETKVKDTKNMLNSYVDKQKISLGYPAHDYEDAIREAGRLLLESACITEEYIEAMVESYKTAGPYAVIAPGLAFPHARPDRGALKTAISLVVLKDAVVSGHLRNDPVRVLFCLAAADSSSHLSAMENIISIAMNQSYVQRMCDIQDVEAMCSLLDEVSKAKG